MNDLPDSGKRRVFNTGSVRDMRSGKGRFDLLPPVVIKRLAQHYENGMSKYGDRNWEKGQPIMSYMDSALRHLFKMMECWQFGEKPEEDHLSAAIWNIGAIIHTIEMVAQCNLPSELDDRPFPGRILGETTKR